MWTSPTRSTPSRPPRASATNTPTKVQREPAHTQSSGRSCDVHPSSRRVVPAGRSDSRRGEDDGSVGRTAGPRDATETKRKTYKYKDNNSFFNPLMSSHQYSDFSVMSGTLRCSGLWWGTPSPWAASSRAPSCSETPPSWTTQTRKTRATSRCSHHVLIFSSLCQLQ